MHSKLTLLLLFAGFLALFNFSLAWPTDSLSLKRASDAEPDPTGTFDLAERADKPGGSHNHTALVECFGKVHECDFNHEARNLTVCAKKLRVCLPTLTAREDDTTDTLATAAPEPTGGQAAWLVCRYVCSDTRSRCRRLTIDTVHRTRCDINYYACNSACNSIPHKRDMDDTELQARAIEDKDIEARNIKDSEPPARDVNPSLEARVEGVAQVPSQKMAAYNACRASCLHARTVCRRNSYTAAQRSRCGINYYACNSFCEGLPHKRDFEDAELEAREAVYDNVEARDADPEEEHEEKHVHPHPPVTTPKKLVTAPLPEGNVSSPPLPNLPFVPREASPVVVKSKLVSGHPPEGKVPNLLTKVPRTSPTLTEYSKCVRGCSIKRVSCKAKAKPKCATKYNSCTKICKGMKARDAEAAPVEEFYPWPPHPELVEASGEFSSTEGRDLKAVEIE